MKRIGAASFFLIVFILLAIGISVRTLGLNKELSGDEALVLRIAAQDFSKIVPLLKNDIYPPLTYILIHYLMKITTSVAWIRLYFVIFGTGVCFSIYLIAREYLNESAGRIALLLSIFSPLLIFLSQYVRSYIDSAFWMLLSSFFFLKIIKGKNRLSHWIGYIAATALSAYTFYGSMLLIFTQFIFIVIFMNKDRMVILRMCLISLFLLLIFLPWLPVMRHQFSMAPGIHYDWSNKGFNLGGLRFGLYTRNIFSIMGFDPYFMSFSEGILTHFGKPILATFVIIGFTAFILFFYYWIKFVKIKFPEDKMLIWFLPFFISVPLVLSWISAALFNTLPNTKYFAVFHSFFLLAMAIFLYSLWEKKRLISVTCIVFILSIYLARFPSAIAAEVESRKALFFLQRNLNNNDCLVCIRSCPEAGVIASIINIENYFKFKEKKSEYTIVSEDAWEELKLKISPYKKVWFYRVYGNIEVFGANRLLDNWLRGQGYKPVEIKRFKNIDIIEFGK